MIMNKIIVVIVIAVAVFSCNEEETVRDETAGYD